MNGDGVAAEHHRPVPRSIYTPFTEHKTSEIEQACLYYTVVYRYVHNV